MFQKAEVAAVFDAYPEPIRSRLLCLRELILEVAAAMPGVGEIEETLKWGQPSYLTPTTRSGSTIRIDEVNLRQYGLYVHCQTTLAATFQQLYPDELTVDGNRCLLFDADADLPVEALKHCIALALTYHLAKKSHQGEPA